MCGAVRHHRGNFYAYIGIIFLKFLEHGENETAEDKVIGADSDADCFERFESLDSVLAKYDFFIGSCNMSEKHLTFGGEENSLLGALHKLAAQIGLKALNCAADR